MTHVRPFAAKVAILGAVQRLEDEVPRQHPRLLFATAAVAAATGGPSLLLLLMVVVVSLDGIAVAEQQGAWWCPGP